MSSPKLRVIFRPNVEIQTFFRPKLGGLQKKKKRSLPKLRVIFRPKSEIQAFFSPKIRWSPKKKKIFTKIGSDFSAGFVRFRLVGRDASLTGAELFEIEADFSAKIVTFRLVGGCIPPLNPPLLVMRLLQWNSVNKSTVNKSSRLLHPICLERNRLVHFRKRRLLQPPRIKSKTGCPEVDVLTEFHCNSLFQSNRKFKSKYPCSQNLSNKSFQIVTCNMTSLPNSRSYRMQIFFTTTMNVKYVG